MKTAKDPRHLKREALVKKLYTTSFFDQKIKTDSDIKDIKAKLKNIDLAIAKGAPDRPIKEINKIDLAILRLSVFELIIKKEVPFKVIVDEAVELAKKYGADSSPGFVNGVLGNIIKSLKLENI